MRMVSLLYSVREDGVRSAFGGLVEWDPDWRSRDLFSGYEPVASLFEVVSAAGTVGLSSGVISADLPVHLKLILCLDMLLGRLEFIALLVLVYPATWINKRFNV